MHPGGCFELPEARCEVLSFEVAVGCGALALLWTALGVSRAAHLLYQRRWTLGLPWLLDVTVGIGLLSAAWMLALLHMGVP